MQFIDDTDHHYFLIVDICELLNEWEQSIQKQRISLLVLCQVSPVNCNFLVFVLNCDMMNK